MKYRTATPEDASALAELNHQLIRDEGHRNPMTVAQLEERMRIWLASGEYQGIIFEAGNEVLAYALFLETDAEIYLRQFFVVRHHRRQGVGRSAMQQLLSNVWSSDKRLTASVLVNNKAGSLSGEPWATPTTISPWRSCPVGDEHATAASEAAARRGAEDRIRQRSRGGRA